jgi:AcrR family transcriptional regulator
VDRTKQRLPAAERRGLVIEAAADAFAERGYDATTTADVARLAGVSQPYVVRLFGTKKDLFMAVTERCFDRVEAVFRAAAADRAPESALLAMGGAYRDLIVNRRDLRLQLHAYAACDDPQIAETVRRRYAGLVHLVHELSAAGGEDLFRFFAHGMMLNVLAATGMIAMVDDPVLGDVVRAATDRPAPA